VFNIEDILALQTASRFLKTSFTESRGTARKFKEVLSKERTTGTFYPTNFFHLAWQLL